MLASCLKSEVLGQGNIRDISQSDGSLANCQGSVVLADYQTMSASMLVAVGVVSWY